MTGVFLKLQGHWIIEMSEMLATSSAKSIEEIRSFISRQKETYRTPYEAQPKDRLRQCVFGGSSNTLDFLPLDRAGNRRFLPIMIYPENAEVHILEDRGRFQSLPVAGLGGGHDGLPQRPLLHEIQASPSSGSLWRRRRISCRRTRRPDRYRAFWNTTPAAWSAPNSFLRRRWATPTMNRSGGSFTISTRS